MDIRQLMINHEHNMAVKSDRFIKAMLLDKKKRTRWTGVGRKKRSEVMRALALKRHAKLTSEEKHYMGVKMAAYRWRDKKKITTI